MQTDGKHGVMPLCSLVISLSFYNMLGMLRKCLDKVTDRMTMYILTAAGAPLDYNMWRHNHFLVWQLRLRASSRSGTNLKLLWISHHTFFGSHQSCQELKIYFTIYMHLITAAFTGFVLISIKLDPYCQHSKVLPCPEQNYMKKTKGNNWV